MFINNDGRLEIFAVEDDGQLHHKWQVTPGGAWSNWHWQDQVMYTPREVNNSKKFFENVILGWKVPGWNVAISNLEQYMTGTVPNPKTLDVNWLRSFDVVGAAEQRLTYIEKRC